MEKYADKYFKERPWEIIEEGFDPSYGRVSESVFSLANEHMGLRGYFEEGYSGDSLQGSYVNGVFERRSIKKRSYKSMLSFSEFMVNSVDWLYVRISCNGETLDLAKSKFENYIRILDMRTGELTREFVWTPDDKTSLKIKFQRVLSMENPEYGAQRIVFESLRGSAKFRIASGLDFSRMHACDKKNYWNVRSSKVRDSFCEAEGETIRTKQRLQALSCFSGLDPDEPPAQTDPKKTLLSFSLELSEGQTASLSRIGAVLAQRCPEEETIYTQSVCNARKNITSLSYDDIKADAKNWWSAQWKISDIEILGDEEAQQGIRYGIFQMHQTMHTADRSAIIGAKGLTGEAYNGNSFWDTETYCLPFYLFNNPEAAKNILRFRSATLGEAKERARELDCKGAFYPIATISGKECCDLWQHANLQLQPSTAAVYGFWHYEKLTADKAFIYEYGAEVLVEVCRMLADRGSWDPVSGEYGYYGVMGPDEFQMMVNHNCYTNYMAKRSFMYALDTLEGMERDCPERRERLMKKTGLSDRELDDWRIKAEKMRILYDEKTMLFEQHDGFYSLPHLDINSIPSEDFPLYHNWSYDRIYRNDMLKQPDVLMFMLLYNSDFTPEQIQANYDYYEPLCIHESSLSPSVHSILACQLGRLEAGYEFFKFASRMDLDNYNRNTGEGLHTTSIAGSWMNVIYGFAGLRSDGEALSLAPAVPSNWESYSFTILYKSNRISVSVGREAVRIIMSEPRENEGSDARIILYGKETVLTPGEEIIIPTKCGVEVSI